MKVMKNAKVIICFLCFIISFSISSFLGQAQAGVGIKRFKSGFW